MKKYTVNQRRNKYWIINALLFHLLKFNPFRRKNLWIFGCWEGQKYDDNARYLFEYVNKNARDITPIWFTHREDLYRTLKDDGYKVELIGTREAYMTQLKAGAVFYTNGMDDFGNICLFYGAKIFNLWHGMILRRGYYNRFKHYGLHYILKRTKDKIYNATYMDYITGTSQYAIRNLCTTFNEKPDIALLTGQPRNDVFKQPARQEDVFKTVRLPEESKIILYMPTHREYEDQTIDETVKLMDSNAFLTEYLLRNNIYIIVKPHYLTKISHRVKSTNILIIEGDEIKSTQELLSISDVLITDYSSCVIDFAIKKRPSIIYAPDLDNYVDKLGLLDPWDQLYPQIAIKDSNEFVETIIQAVDAAEESLVVTDLFNSYYEDDTLGETLFSENVFNAAYKLVFEGGNAK